MALPDELPQVSHTTAAAMTGCRECDATPPPAKCQSSRDASSPKGNRLPYARRLPHVAHLRRSSRDATARAVMPWAGSPLYEEAPLTCASACRSKDLPRSRDVFEGSISLWQTHSPQSRCQVWRIKYGAGPGRRAPALPQVNLRFNLEPEACGQDARRIHRDGCIGEL